jgi:choline monooxygenase
MSGSVDALVDTTQQRLAIGATPPPSWYREPALYQQELDVLFPAAWELISTVVTARSVDLVEAHDTVAGGLLVWGDSGYVNACAHRGKELLALGQSLSARMLRCGYHGWRFGPDGGRIGAGRRADGLVPVEIGAWGDLVFASRRPSQSLSELLGEAPAMIEELGVDLATLGSATSVRTTSYLLACNWKVAVENSLECYHCPIAHPQLRTTADINTSESVVCNGSRTIGRFLAPATGPDNRRTVVHQAHWLFPNQSVSTWPGPCPSVIVNHWVPLGPESTRWDLTRYWLGDVDEADVDAGWAYSLTFAEQDAALVEGVRRGIRNGWPGGRYVLDGPFSERGPSTFAGAVVSALRQQP